MTAPADESALLAEQRAFYRARAPEYDDWWERRGRYATDAEHMALWNRQVAEVERALDEVDSSGSVLELAGGTGWWTKRLARTASRLTVIDAAEETLVRNQRRVARPDVDYVVADLFSWQPERTYDLVFFSFWLSHVPRARFSAFWELVRACLGPGGRAFLIDNRNDPIPSLVKDPHVLHYGDDLHLRELDDGRQYRVVKVMYEPDELQSLLADIGWSAQIRGTRWFIFGEARPLGSLPINPA